jgi:creatinine amidohydrolase
MRYGDLTYKEISRCADEKWLIIIPTGCTEQQGPHLPVDFDTWFVDQVTVAASEKAEQEHGVHSLVLPVIPFGPTPEHRNFGSGYIDLPEGLHDSLLEAVLQSISEQGFRNIIIWRGCGQHDFKSVVERFNNSNLRGTKAYIPDLPYNDIMQSISPGIPGGHADSFSTSLAIYLRPESVRMTQIPNPEIKPVDWKDPKLDFTNYSSSGVIGDPSHASYDLGARLWGKLIDNVALTFKKYAKV